MKTEEIALGALLHDIGKFLQRACPPGTGLGEQSRRLQEMACPSAQGRSSHLHVLYTNEFFATMPFLPPGLDAPAVANLAVYHHRPDTPEQEIIAEADRLSSAMEREAAESEEPGGAARSRRTAMLSVASTVSVEGVERVAPSQLKLAVLAPADAFPVPAPAAQDDLTPRYSSLWTGFREEWAANRCGEPIEFINRAASTLERFTWCIPSATNAVPDISLYDHLKTASAIAVCLSAEDVERERPFLLVAGDLSGIQDYIFAIRPGSGGLARRLRSRSFDINAFMESVSLGILRELGLPLTHRILFAGGKFHLLLPNAGETVRCLDRIRASASEWLFERSAGVLHLAMASLGITRNELRFFSDCTMRLLVALGEEKNRPGAGLLSDSGGWTEQQFLLRQVAIGEDAALCPSCRARPAVQGALCTDCEADARRGQLLPKARFVAFYSGRAGASEAPMGSYQLAPAHDGLAAPMTLVLDMDGLPAAPSSLPLVSAYKARYVPRNPDGDVTTFEEIAARSHGRAALGYLKMDVDNLGFIFSHGLTGATGDRTSISRVATLSRTLEVFFAGHLESLLKTEYPNVYLVYSGGDDLLAIGPWNAMFDLAERIRDDFRRYTGDNPAWTVSAGIAVLPSDTPVLHAVEAAQRYLDASKSIPGADLLPTLSAGTGVPLKDRITAFETSIPWSRFPAVLGTAKTLLGWVESGVLNTAKVRRLLHYSDLYRKFQGTGRTVFLQYAPLLARDLRRNWPEKTDDERQAKTWAGALAAPNSHEIKALHFICHYALYGARSDERRREQ